MKPKSKPFKSKDVAVKGYYTIIVVIALLFIDRLTKAWATNLSKDIDYGIVEFTYVTNTGAGFSILQGQNFWLMILAAVTLALIIYFHKQIPKFSIMMLIPGIIGNLMDRIFYGHVIDFINFKFWPIFNMSDTFIFIGVAYWIILIFKSETPNIEDNATNKQQESKKIKNLKNKTIIQVKK